MVLSILISIVLFVSALCAVGGFAAYAIRSLENFTVPGAVIMGLRGAILWGMTPIRLVAGATYAIFASLAFIFRFIAVAGDFRGDMNTTMVMKAFEQVFFNQINRKMVSDYVLKIGEMKSRYDSMKNQARNTEYRLEGEIEALHNVIGMVRAGHNPALAWAQYETIKAQRNKYLQKQAKKAAKNGGNNNDNDNGLILSEPQTVTPPVSQWWG